MNKKGFAISVVLYSMVILVIGIFYLLLGIVRNRYMVGDTLKEVVINLVDDYFPVKIPENFEEVMELLPLTEPDSDGTRFVYGSDIDNNYVWYSGKLWRIVSIDSDGNIKLVTQGNVTSVAWDTSSSNTDYSTSQIRSWLNNEFLPTLHNVDNLLVDTIWDYTTYESFPTTTTEKLETTSSVTEKVGLLNIYEYMMTGGTDDENTSATFLNNDYNWWTISPKTSGSKVWYFYYYVDSVKDYCPARGNGIRPAINLKSGITILGGTGKKTNPYTIEGDKEAGAASELLSNRTSGEYIKFNNTKYRIVGVEDGLTKITMADYSINKNSIGSVAFGSGSSQRIFSTTYGIGLYLQEWYEADETSTTYASTYINETYKAMIATDGITWYIGPTSGTEYDYTLSKTATTVETPIGLGYYGEMFSSQFGEGHNSSIDTWLMTINTSQYTWHITYYGIGYNYADVSYSYGVRPSFYLKSDVKITSGTGLPHDPYEITM